MSYTLNIDKPALTLFKKLPKNIQRNLIEKAQVLTTHPTAGQLVVDPVSGRQRCGESIAESVVHSRVELTESIVGWLKLRGRFVARNANDPRESGIGNRESGDRERAGRARRARRARHAGRAATVPTVPSIRRFPFRDGFRTDFARTLWHQTWHTRVV